MRSTNVTSRFPRALGRRVSFLGGILLVPGLACGTSSGGGGSGGSGMVAGGSVATAGGASATAAGGGSSGGPALGGRSGAGGEATAPSGGGSDGVGGASSGESGGASAAGGAAGETGGGANVGGASNADGGATSSEACTPSRTAGNIRTSGSGPYDVVVETNTDPGIAEGTIFRPSELGGDEKFPIFVWGQGGCSRNGLANEKAMVEIASHGYFVVADGTPGGSGNRTMDRSQLEAMGAPLLAYVDWAIEENIKPCSAYFGTLETTKVASNGFSCGGLMSQGTVLDPRIVTWGVTSSGMAGASQDFYDLIETPVLFVEGGEGDVAYDGAVAGYEAIAEIGVPVMWFSKALGHGGDLLNNDGGDFTKINLAWLNWWLKGDESATGKGLLVGAGCPFCSDNTWDVRSAHLP